MRAARHLGRPLTVLTVAGLVLGSAGGAPARARPVPAGRTAGRPAVTAKAGSLPAADRRQQLYPLPDGDHVAVSGTGDRTRIQFVPAAGHRGDYVSTRMNGVSTVLPAGQLTRSPDLAMYQVGGAAANPASGGTVSPQFAMSRLVVKAVDHAGNPAAAAEVVVMNVDDPAKASWDGIMVDGDARIQVPYGNYSVGVIVFDTDAAGNPTETDLLTATDVAVPAAGTTVSLDGRSARRVAFTTPLPSVQADFLVDWIRGTATRQNVTTVGVTAGTPLYVSAAPAAQHGILTYRVSGRTLSPSSASSPYSYVLTVPAADHIPATQTYPIAATSLDTLDSADVTDQPSQRLALADGWTLAHPAAHVPDYPGFQWTPARAPGDDRVYLSALPGVDYLGYMLPLPNAGLDGELTRTFQPKAGGHDYLTWRGGLIVPAPSTIDGPCFLCRQGDVVHGVGVMDTDASGDVGQWNDGPTTITQDGATVYSGGTVGQEFDQKVAAGKHHFVYSIDATPMTSPLTALSAHSKISWGFDSQTVTTSTVPASFGCTPCAPLPILFADAWFVADGHESVGPGTARFEADLQHQPYAADPATTSASASVSYDGGTTWQSFHVTISGGHHISGAFTVPSTLKPGYLAVKFSAEDSAGSTVDETVQHAALVNAPQGIALPAAPAPVVGPAPAGTRAVCPAAAAGQARCFALWTPTARGGAAAATTSLPAGLARADLVSAYHLPATGGAGRTVAIVDAGDDPTAEQDLAVYRSTYKLPPCTTANGCFSKVNQNGKTSPLPAYNPDDDWSTEVSLDVQMVSAVCPDCHILLVEGDDASIGSLGTAVASATRSGAVAVSNSWGADENGQEAAFAAGFSHAGVAVTASTGDAGFRQGQWPASLAGVIAVGGTSLTRAAGTTRGWAEKAWAGAGSGCSAYIAKPAWQHDAHCTMRTAADISAVADPKTGVAVYAQGSWGTVGGTSASSPIIAAMIALAGNSAALPNAQYIYSHTTSLNDVTSGSNANWNCGGDYLCTAVTGYDGPTGMGTPNGLGAL